uniref:Coatomer subunit zeta n=1 Tax=Sander lucioperca TaxID=283035 RepID=A0A8D0AG13_SANLU
METGFMPSIMMIRTRQSRSRRHLRRTYSTKHTGRTVRCVYYIKDSLSCLSTCLITCMVAFCVYLGEIALLEGLTVVYKSNIDLFFYVIGSSHENELMLMAVLNCLFDSLSQMLRKNVERRALLENMEGLFLAVDEIVDGGVILESDPQQVVHRVALRGDDVPLTEQTVTQVLQSAKEQIKWSLLR